MVITQKVPTKKVKKIAKSVINCQVSPTSAKKEDFILSVRLFAHVEIQRMPYAGFFLLHPINQGLLVEGLLVCAKHRISKQNVNS